MTPICRNLVMNMLFFLMLLNACAPAVESEKKQIPDTPAVVKGEHELGWLISPYMNFHTIIHASCLSKN